MRVVRGERCVQRRAGERSAARREREGEGEGEGRGGGAFSPIFWVIICRNSSNSIVPEPSLSISSIIFLISSCRGETHAEGWSDPPLTGGVAAARRAEAAARLLRLKAERAHRHLELLGIDRACRTEPARRPCRGERSGEVMRTWERVHVRRSRCRAPEPSVSNRSNASRISCFCSSVSSDLPGLPFPPAFGRRDIAARA